MTCFKPFQAFRPRIEYAQQALCPPYDVVTREEAEAVASKSPNSFMHVIRAEVDLPGAEQYSDAVYQKSAENLAALESRGIFFSDEKPLYYIYSQTMDGRSQTGIVGCSSIDDYENGIIKKHEITRTEKELDRIRHFDICSADTEPVFYFFRNSPEISAIISDVTGHHEPEYDATDDAHVRHRLWPIFDEQVCRKLEKYFEELPELYIADGHHRTASAAKVGKKRREAFPDYDGSEEFNRFMAVAFPADQLKVYDYNRLVKDLNGLSEKAFFEKLSKVCEISEIEAFEEKEILPKEKHTCSMYIAGKWYTLTFHDFPSVAGQISIQSSCDAHQTQTDGCSDSASTASVSDAAAAAADANKSAAFDSSAVDPVKALDVSFLQENVLSPLLGITDPKTDTRIGFVGGIKGPGELKRRVDSGEMAVAFAMYPVSVEEIMAIADAGLVMPPKSTWFEPKLGSGLFVHKFEKK